MYKLTEAAQIAGIPLERLRTWVRRGKIRTVDIIEGERVYRALDQTTLDALCGNLSTQAKREEYERLLAQYLDELRAGLVGRRPVSAKYADNINWALGQYWRYLDETPSLAALSADKFRDCMLRIPIDESARRDFFATRLQIFKAVAGFYRLLVRDGLKTEDERRLLTAFKPRAPRYRDVPEYPDAEQFRAALDFNETWISGRTAYDRALLRALLCLYGYAGIRKMEAANLVIADIDFERASLLVWGKGGKRRRVPMHHSLAESLRDWLKARAASAYDWLLVQACGAKMTETAIERRFSRLSHAMGIKIRPHGLRHACATVLALEGWETILIQAMLGHSSSRTTDIYLNPTERDLFRRMAETNHMAAPKPSSKIPRKPSHPSQVFV